jgi:O-antigen/teichoic acid export membrane protein
VAADVANSFAAYHSAGNRDALVSFAASTIRWTFWPSLAATIVSLALGKPIRWLVGPDVVGGSQLRFILAVSLIARAAVGPAERVLNMLGEQRSCALVYACVFAINLVLALVLAPRYGGTGVAVAMTCAVLAESVLLFVVAKRRLGLHLFIWRRRMPDRT